jgi:hypothetical protein
MQDQESADSLVYRGGWKGRAHLFSGSLIVLESGSATQES